MATRERPLLQNTSANIFMVFPSAAGETRQKEVFFKLLGILKNSGRRFLVYSAHFLNAMYSTLHPLITCSSLFFRTLWNSANICYYSFDLLFSLTLLSDDSL
jgi:hypothetical protein